VHLHEQSDSAVENSNPEPLSDILERSPRSPSKLSKAQTNANTSGELAISYLPVKSNTAAEPADSIMSTPTDGVTATAVTATKAEMRDSITDTDIAGTSQSDKPTIINDISNFRVNLANSDTTAMRAQHSHVSVDVANRPRPSQASCPQRIRHPPARILCQVHARQYESGFQHSFDCGSPSCSDASENLRYSCGESTEFLMRNGFA